MKQPGWFVRVAWFMWGGIAALMILLVLMLAPMQAHAKVVAIGKAKGDVVTLTDEPCKSVVMQKVKPEYRKHFMAATYYIGQKNETVAGCYWLYESNYITIWEDGDVFELPMSFFKQAKANAPGVVSVSAGIRG